MKNKDIQIVEMEPENISTIKKIETESGLSNWSEQDYLREIEKNNTFFKTISYKNEIIGFILAHLITSELQVNFNEAEIFNIAIKKRFRHKNFGSFLLNALIDACRKHSIVQIWLEVRQSNSAAIDFYNKNGFEKVSERKIYYTNPVEDAIIMKLVLHYNDEKNEKFKT